MMRALGVTVVLVAMATTSGCGLLGGSHTVRASGSTRYFFEQLDHADALADPITLPRSLADTLPNRRYVSTRPGSFGFAWTKRVVVGRVTSVSGTSDHRVRLRIRVQESFPATTARTVDVLAGGAFENEKRYLASAASLDRVVVGIDSFKDDSGRTQTVVAMSSQLLGVVDDRDRISFPVLKRQDFEKEAWNRGMTTLAGLRREATAAPSTIAFGRG